MDNLITAVVPARAGSQRIKNKNTRPFMDTTLLDIKLDMLTQIKSIDKIIVSTDCQIATKIAEKYEVDIHKRDPYYASSKCTNSEFFQNMADYVPSGNILYAPCTAPLIKKSTYYDFINRYSLSKNKNLVTATLVKEHLWLNNKPINYRVDASPNTQDLPDVMSINYGLSIISRELLLENKNIVSKTPDFYLLEKQEGVDIDTLLDFEFAEFLYTKLKNNEI
jgi:CMP-N-acetylneuraminic acid synthetase